MDYIKQKHTAIEWLYEQIKNINKVEYAFSYFEAFEQAKAMEKEQIIKAFNEGTFSEMEKIDAEQYYSERFIKE